MGYLESLAMAMEVLPTILMEAVATHTGVLRVFMVTMVGMDIMDMVRDLLRLNLDMDMVMDMVLLLSMSPRLTMDMDTTLPSTPTDTTLDTDMARGPLMPSLDMVTAMLSATHTEAPRVSMDTMEVTDMEVTMARD